MPVLDLTFASGESSLSVRRFSVHEALSSLFTVSVWARASDPSLDLGALLGYPASFRIASGMAHAALGGGRLWRGMVSFIEQVQAEVSDKGLSTYYLRLVPSLWMLTQRRNHRIFQHISIPDIADALLDEWGIEHVWKIDRGRYAKLEYRVQYGESDYAFLSRLFEEAGIAFSFPDDEQEGSTLTLGDKLHLKPPRPVSPLRYVDNPGGAAEKEYVTHVRLAQEVRPGAHTIRDDDFRNPAYPLFGEAPQAKSPEDRYEQYHYQPGAFLVETGNGGDTPVADDRGITRHDQRSGKDRAERALLGERMGRQGVSFDTNVIDLRPGTVFAIDHHPHPELDAGKKLLVTELSLEGSPGGEWSMAGHAVFADVPYQPPLRTPKPQVLSVQSATVVGPSGQEIHTDEFGRVRVQFPWDREGKLDEKSSCWIRVNQGWGGAGYGMLVLPRIGQEVLIGFLEGNPDQPILVGRVFNQTNPVPYKLPENKTISTWKSNSSQGSDGFNELKFEDKKADELVYIQAEKNLRQLVKHDETITVLNNREKLITLNDTDTTGVNRIEVTGANRSDTTGANHLTVIGNTRTKLIKQHESERTEESRTLRAAKILDVVVKKRKRERVEEDVHLHVKGERREKIDQKQSLTVVEDQQEHVDGSHALAAGMQIHLVAGEQMVGEAQDVTLKGPGGFIRIDAGGVTIKGTLVEINTGGGKAGKGKGSRPEAPEEQEEQEEQEEPALPKTSAKPKDPASGATPAGCEYLNKPYTVEAPEKTFDNIRIKHNLGSAKEEKHKFPGDAAPSDAVVQEAKVNGQTVKVIMPKAGAPPGKHLPTAEQVAGALGTVPKKQLKNIKQIVISPNANPNDAYWAKEYKTPNFSSAATGGNGGVTFYPTNSEWNQAFVDSTMIHEGGHTYSTELWKNKKKEKAWKDIIEKDKPNSPSTYADSSAGEDFSETLVMYSLSKGTKCEKKAKELYPARYKALDAMFRNAKKP